MKAKKNIMEGIATLCLVAAVAGFWLLAGNSFRQMMSDPVSLEEYLHGASGKTLKDAEGAYVTYDAMYPLSSCAEEYYSGDANRVMTLGYPIYDEESGICLYVVINEQRDSQLGSRLSKFRLPQEQWGDLKPIRLSGTLEVMDDDMIQRALKALEDYKKSVVNRIEGAKELAQNQTEWYMLRENEIDGLKPGQIIGCMLAAGLCLLILVYRVLAFLLRAVRKKSEIIPASQLDQFILKQQGAWVEAWCQDYDIYARKISYCTVLILVIVMGGIGLLVGYSPKEVAALHLSWAVFLGSLAGVLAWCFTHKGAKADKLLGKIRKGVEKALSTPGMQEAFAEDMLNVEKEWQYRNVRKSFSVHTMCIVLLGEHYCCRMAANGEVTVIDTQRLKAVKNGSSGQRDVWSFGIWYQQPEERKMPDQSFLIWGEEAAGELMYLMKKKIGDGVKYIGN